ncbi:MAG: hypothetical protein Q4G64_08115 [bacterium]|nr:hypothetical protein [bacterium]
MRRSSALAATAATAALAAVIALAGCTEPGEQVTEGTSTVTPTSGGATSTEQAELFTADPPEGFTPEPGPHPGRVVWAASDGETRLEVTAIPPGTELPPGQPMVSLEDVDVDGTPVGAGTMLVGGAGGHSTLVRLFLPLHSGGEVWLHWVDAITPGTEDAAVDTAHAAATDLARSLVLNEEVTLGS